MRRKDRFVEELAMLAALKTIAQSIAIVMLGLVVGSMFGIWRGYDPATYSVETFLEVHQNAVRGLNLLLPLLGALTLAIIVGLAVGVRRQPNVLVLYGLAALLVALGGIVTRFGNQPINELVMDWTAGKIPQNWAEVRDSWWHWHLVRLAATFVANILLINAVLRDRIGPRRVIATAAAR
jgi:hypothetical protein